MLVMGIIQQMDPPTRVKQVLPINVEDKWSNKYLIISAASEISVLVGTECDIRLPIHFIPFEDVKPAQRNLERKPRE